MLNCINAAMNIKYLYYMSYYILYMRAIRVT